MRMRLTANIRGSRIVLGVQGVELLVKTSIRRHSRIDGATYGFACGRHGATSVDCLARRPKNRGPFHLLPVIAWAIFDRLS
jgi:hypothetical protein